MAAMGIAITTYLMLLEVLISEAFFACPCAQLLPRPCTCQAGFMPFCACIRPILQYSCPCSIPPPPCHATCQRTCTSMCAQNRFGPSCPSYCGLSCLQSCMHQQAVPIQIVITRLAAPPDQCIPFCRKNCEKFCTPMVSATCIPLCKQPCEQKCSQFTPTGVANFEKLGQPIYKLIASLALLTQPALLPTISQKKPNDSSTSTSSPTTLPSRSTPLGPTLITSSAFETTPQPQTAEGEGEFVDIPMEDSKLTSPTERMALSEESQDFNDSTTPETEVSQLQRAVRLRFLFTSTPSTRSTFTTASHAPFTQFTFTTKSRTNEEITPKPDETMSEAPASHQILEKKSPEQKGPLQMPLSNFSDFKFTTPSHAPFTRFTFTTKLKTNEETTPKLVEKVSQVPVSNQIHEKKSLEQKRPLQMPPFDFSNFTFTTVSQAPFTRFTFTTKSRTNEETTPKPDEKMSEMPTSGQILEESPEQKRSLQMPPFDFSNFNFTSMKQCIAACMPECDPKCIEEQGKLIQKPAYASTDAKSSERQMDYKFEFQRSSPSNRKIDVSRLLATSALL